MRDSSGDLQRVLLDSGGEHQADVVTLGEEDLERRDLALRCLHDGQKSLRQGLVALEDDLSRGGVDDVGGSPGPLEIGLGDLYFLDAQLADLFEDGSGDALSSVEDLVTLVRLRLARRGWSC